MPKSLKHSKMDVEKLIQGFDEETKQEVYTFIKQNKLNTSILHPNRYYNAMNLLNYISSIYGRAYEHKLRHSNNDISEEKLQAIPERFRGAYKKDSDGIIRERSLISLEEHKDIKVLSYRKGKGNKSLAEKIVNKVSSMIRTRGERDYESLDERYNLLLKLAEISKIEDVTNEIRESRKESGHRQIVEEMKYETSLRGRIVRAVDSRKEENEIYEESCEKAEIDNKNKEEQIKLSNQEKIRELRERQKRQREELERQQEAELKKLLKENDEALKKHQEECETSKRDRDNTHEYFLEKIKAKALEKMKDVTD